MNVPTKIILEAIAKLPEIEHYPYKEIQVPWIRFPVIFNEDMKIDSPKILTFRQSDDGTEWELISLGR
jgi:hypothetical protein